jgi:excisionase family DNA binding protein
MLLSMITPVIAVDPIDAPKVIRTRPARPSQRLLTVPQSAEQYGIPERSVHDLIARGLLPYVRFEGGRRIWLDRQDLEALVAASKEKRA